MANDFEGSIAQQFVTFATTQSIESVVGDNYQKVMIFIDEDSAAANFTGTPPAVNNRLVVDSTNYATLTEGTLLAWLTGFFATNSITEVWLVVFAVSDPVDPADLEAAFDLFHAEAYFKMIMGANSYQVALSDLCDTDTLLSQFWCGTSDTECLNPASTTSIAYLLNQADSVGVLVYSTTGTTNPALDQLGLSLSTLNVTGYSVGNQLDYIRTLNRDASGTAGANLPAADVQDLMDQNIGFWLTVGNNTGSVALRGGLTLTGVPAAANWLQNFIDYTAAVATAELLTDPANPRFRNNDTYQAILQILTAKVRPFVQLGRLTNFKITAPPFAQLPAGGDTITVPNAWRATFLDNVREVTVNGTIYITVG
jgi:hypothetical protein